MLAPESGWARKLRRQILLLCPATVVLPVAAFGQGALAVGAALRDGPPQPLNDAETFAKHAESSLPPEPTPVRFVTEAARFCRAGNRAAAHEALEALRECLRV